MTARNIRGRLADDPSGIPPGGWFDVLWRVKDKVLQDNIGLVAAGIAFYGLLAIFPGIAAIMAIAGLLVDPGMIAGEIGSLTSLMPTEAATIILDQAKKVAGSQEAGLGFAAIIGLMIALYSASRGIGNLIIGTNIAYDETETRGFFRLQLLILGFTLLAVVAFIVASIVMIGVPIILETLYLGAWSETIATWLRWPLLFGMMITGVSVIYRWGPNRARAKWRWITPGALVACGLWVVGTAAFAIYVRNFASYNETFGALGGAVILLMWLWLTSFIVLLGASFDAEMEAQTRIDTTTGPARPMGERGATKADELGELR